MRALVGPVTAWILLSGRYMTNPANALSVPLHWRTLESPLLAGVFGEAVIDFYGRLISPALTARRVIARVEAVRDEARDVKSFVLKANGHFRGFRAGQHVNLTVEINGTRYSRCYSPSNAPNAERCVVLTVKRHVGGRVSEWLHAQLRVGAWVELSQAFGDFTLPEHGADKLLFIAGGSGITPIASLVRAIMQQGTACDVTLLIYARSPSDLIFAQELRALQERRRTLRVHVSFTRSSARADLYGHLSVEHLERVAPDVAQRQTFACGPRGLIDTVQALWSQRAWSLPKLETFTPLAPIASADAVASDGAKAECRVQVTATTTGRTFVATTGASLLVQAERAGLSPVSGCRQGICFSCACRKRSGTVRNLSSGALSSEPDEEIRLCISTPMSDVTLDL